MDCYDLLTLEVPKQTFAKLIEKLHKFLQNGLPLTD